MTANAPAATRAAGAWQPVSTGDDTIAVARRDALGTGAIVATWPPEHLDRACTAVDSVLAALDQQASRFRPDSELSWLHRRGGGCFLLSDGLAEAVGVALAAARWTARRADPTVGGAVIALGYDRDFAAVDRRNADPPGATGPAPGWELVQLDGPVLRLPDGLRLDLGATAKGIGSDRAAAAAMRACGRAGGVLVSLGGDIAVGGTPPRDGWPVTVADGPDPSHEAATQLVGVARGGVATSSVTCRRWQRAGQVLHHIVDPATGQPAAGRWRTASVAAATCADANAASTAAIVAGDAAEAWLAAAALPARLVGRDGEVRCLGGWPPADGATLPAPPGTVVYRGAWRTGGPR